MSTITYRIVTGIDTPERRYEADPAELHPLDELTPEQIADLLAIRAVEPVESAPKPKKEKK